MSRHLGELSGDSVRLALSPFDVDPSDLQVEQIQEYIRLLMKWNKLISLTSIQDPQEMVARHFGESIFGNCVLPVENCRLADVGTGGGFPGLALKIAVPSLKLTLIESSQRKSAFLSEVIRALGLSDVSIISARFEDIRSSSDLADVITARALGRFPALLRWASKSLTAGGNIILWLGLDDLNSVSRTAGWLWQPAVKIPESQRRYLLLGRAAKNASQPRST